MSEFGALVEYTEFCEQSDPPSQLFQTTIMAAENSK